MRISLRNFRHAIVVGYLCSSNAVPAQTVINADAATLQPTVSRDGKGFKSCGVRAVVIDRIGKDADIHDFSINIYTDSFSGMIKAGRYKESSMRAAIAGGAIRPILPAPVGFWITKASDSVALRPRLIVPAESAGFILGGTEIAATLNIMFGMAKGERIQFATSSKGEKIERIISFAAEMGEADFTALSSCIEGSIVRMKARVETTN